MLELDCTTCFFCAPQACSLPGKLNQLECPFLNTEKSYHHWPTSKVLILNHLHVKKVECRGSCNNTPTVQLCQSLELNNLSFQVDSDSPHTPMMSRKPPSEPNPRPHEGPVSQLAATHYSLKWVMSPSLEHCTPHYGSVRLTSKFECRWIWPPTKA